MQQCAKSGIRRHNGAPLKTLLKSGSWSATTLSEVCSTTLSLSLPPTARMLTANNDAARNISNGNKSDASWKQQQ